MKVALVTETYRPEANGVAMTLGRLVDHLAATDNTVDLITPTRTEENPTPNTSMMALPGLALPGYPGVRFGLPAVRRLTSSWHQCRPDVAYIATQGPLGWAALRAARRLRLPTVSGYHTHFTDYSRHYGLGVAAPLVDGYLRRFHQRSGLTLAPTHALADELRRAGFGAVDVLPRGVDTERFSPDHRNQALRSRWGVMPGTPVVLYVGRLAPEKNLALAIRAFRAVQASQPHARFVLVGDGPSRAALEAENPDFIFAGTRHGADLAAHYASADLFLFPSLTDTFGNVVMEAMASGLPVVAYDLGAAAEHIRSFRNGVVAPPENADRFVALTILLGREARLRERFGGLARTSVRHHGWAAVGARFQRLLEQRLEWQAESGVQLASVS